MIIDCHGHYTTAPKELGEYRKRQKAELEQILADPELYNDQEAFTEKSRDYNTVERHLERAYAKWEEILIPAESRALKEYTGYYASISVKDFQAHCRIDDDIDS